MTPPARKPLNLADLAPRLVSALVLAFLAIFAAWKGDQIFILFWLIASAAMFWEWTNIVQKGATLQFAIGAVALAALAPTIAGGNVLYGAGILLVAFILLYVVSPNQKLWFASGILYAGLLLAAVIMLRFSFPLGMPSIFWLFAVVWGTDVMAYFGGRLIGGPKLWPRVSPSKTWSGFLCGISCGALAGLLVAPKESSILAVLLIGFVTGAVAQGGDLLESSIKRHFGVKDASNLIPGHGGFMDRLDGFLAAAVFACLIGALRSGLSDPANGLLGW